MSFDIKSVDEEKFEVEGIFSTDDEDRHGERVFQNWDLKNFKKNPVILNSHNYRDITEILGKSTKISVKDNRLEGKIQFAVNENPKAKVAYELVRGGFANAFSVGYIGKEFDEKWNTLKAELLEISLVSVPANALALAKAKGIDVDVFLKEEEEPAKVEVEPIEDEPEAIDDENEDGPETEDHVVTEEDLKNNPELAGSGVEVGDTIQILKKEPDDEDIEKEEENPEEEPPAKEDEEEKKPEGEEEPKEEPKTESLTGVGLVIKSLEALASELKVVTLEQEKSEQVRANAKRLLNSAIRSLVKERNKI